MDDGVNRLAQARDWYVRAVDAIPADGWAGPTLCAGWTPAHVVAHVISGDQLFGGILLDAFGKDRTGLDLPVDLADRRRRFEAMTTWEPARLQQAARTESERTVAAITEAAAQAPEMVVTVPFGAVPIPVVRALRLNEYVIHGHDLMPAIGRSMPVPEGFIDRQLGESITLMQRLHERSPHKGESASFHLHRTDGEGEWILRAEAGRAVAEAGHGDADATLRGPGESLYWVILGRGKPEYLEVELQGDRSLAARFKEWFPGP
ncbi:MAG TPA: maleylpyruvate isomerase family mycothiol-dependent enzyme [Candidatus Limnocylindrales bacterium]|nr:maleylpyruvate isomerase family mycothiol-dependent enzyme [Candidatus Limnocylindrales bacterium]